MALKTEGGKTKRLLFYVQINLKCFSCSIRGRLLFVSLLSLKMSEELLKEFFASFLIISRIMFCLFS